MKKNLNQLQYEIEEAKKQINIKKKEALKEIQEEYTNIMLNWFDDKEEITERDITSLLKDYRRDIEATIKDHTV